MVPHIPIPDLFNYTVMYTEKCAWAQFIDTIKQSFFTRGSQKRQIIIHCTQIDPWLMFHDFKDSFYFRCKCQHSVANCIV